MHQRPAKRAIVLAVNWVSIWTLLLAGGTRIRCVGSVPTNWIPTAFTLAQAFRQTNLLVCGAVMLGTTKMEIHAGLAQQTRVWQENIVMSVQLVLILTLSV